MQQQQRHHQPSPREYRLVVVRWARLRAHNELNGVPRRIHFCINRAACVYGAHTPHRIAWCILMCVCVALTA
jgi:hypothetical protein